MKNGITKVTFLLFFLTITFSATAQTSAEGSTSNLILYTLLTVAALVLIAVILQISESLIRIEAKEMGVDGNGENFGIIPNIRKLFTPAPPEYVGKDSIINLKKGHDILLEGEADKIIQTDVQVNTFAVQPKNFVGMSPIPKLFVEVGQSVKAGDQLFFDKKRPEIKYVSPVSGEIVEVRRAEKRSISEVVILKDKEIEYRSFDKFDLEEGSREDLVNYLLETGIWPSFIQRPFNLVANPTEIPANIFVSTFDSAPLAPDLNFVVEGKEAAFQKGLDVLNKLTGGKVYLGLDARGENAPATAFTNAEGVEKRWFKGPHPSGNVGVQIHHIAPVNANLKAWTVGVQDVITIGTLLLEGRYDASRLIAVTGAEVAEPKYIATYLGANVGELLKGSLKEGNNRIVAGDVLSGKQKSSAGFLDYSTDQITVLAEGDYYELFGWLVPIAPRPSISKTFPNFLYPNYRFEADTNTHGEKRAFVMTGQYESVLPMDILAQHLMKAIIVNDFERMEGLGIYELAEEDVALCEFVCTSKQPLQSILREGLDAMLEQG